MKNNVKTSAIYTLPDNYIYISHLDEDLKYWVLPVYPDAVSDSMQSTFESNYALGRSAPVYTYSNSGPRTVNVDLKLHRDLMDDVNEAYSNTSQGIGEDYVDNLIHALQSISVPKYNLDNKAIEPPLVAIRLGSEVFIKGVVFGSISVTYQKPIISTKYGDKYAQVEISFSVNEVDPYDATAIYTNGSFRGVVSTLKHGMGLEEEV